MTAGRALHVRLDLVEPVIASARADTAGAAESLDHIPGAMLLGVAAAALYDDLDPQARRQAFHGGVSFGNARPLDADGQLARPVPFALHRPKLGRPWEDEQLGPEVRNLSAEGARRDEVQWVQLRGDFITPDGRRVQVARTGGLKTAIDPATRRAAEAQLFQLEAIEAGQAFAATIRLGDTDEGLADGVARVFDNGHLRIGRSRSAEFGLVRTTLLERAPDSWAGTPPSDVRVLWALSDIVLPGAGGATLEESLGLEGRIDAARSFVRWRSHVPFNGHWRRRGLERVSICQGSVIVLTRVAGDDGVADRGLGVDREWGFGQVAEDDRLLSGIEPGLAGRTSTGPARPDGAEPEKPPAGIAAWAARRVARGADSARARERVDDWLEALCTGYEKAARLAGADPYEIGPSASQWGDVRAVLETGQDSAAIERLLFDERDGCARASHDDWRVSLGGAETFHTLLGQIVSESRHTALLVAKDIGEELARRRRS